MVFTKFMQRQQKFKNLSKYQMWETYLFFTKTSVKKKVIEVSQETKAKNFPR